MVGGGGEMTVAEVDDLETTTCGIGDFAFLIARPNQFPPRGGKERDLE